MEPQRWGDFVAVETLSQTSLGTVYKALNLEGDPRIHFLKVFPQAVASCSSAATLLQAHGARWQNLRDLYTLHLEHAGFSGDHFLAAFEYRQGRLLSDILDQAAKEGIPLAPDQAVYLAERIAGALLSLSTQDQHAGALSPEDILVTFEGEVKLFPILARDLATTDLRAEGLLGPILAYQPEEVRGGKKAKASADRFALGALLFEFLVHQPLRPEGQETDVAARLQEARGGLGMGDPLPEKLAAILEKALLPGTPGAYETIDAFKADLDQLITSGEYSPSTFNMAFLMHTLFRDEEEAEAAKDQGCLALDRSPFLTPPAAPEPEAPPAPKPKRRVYVPPPVQESSGTEPNFIVQEEPSRKGLWISLAVTGVIVVIAVLSYLAFGRKSGPSPEEIQAQIDARVAAERATIQKEQQELAAKLEAAQKEKEALEQQASQARTADERAKAQKALEETQRKIEAQKQEQAALNQKAAATTGAPAPAAAEPPKAPPPQPSAPASQPAAAPATAPATPPATEPAVTPPEPPAGAGPAPASGVKAGDFVEIFAVDVKPKELQGLKVEYTPQARQNRLQGTIYLEVDIDETGAVTGARAVRAPPSDYGMKDALVAATRKMRFTPAIKEGVPVKTKLTFPVRMEIK